jgi:sporulation protein YlmC with PRC-barrel domain
VAQSRHDFLIVMERTMKFPNSNPFRRSLLAGAVAAGLALSMGQAAAQTSDSQATRQTTDTKQSTETKRAEKDARKSWEQAHRASKIIGSDVRNAQDEKVGKVKDLVLADPSSGTISHVVVSVGGVAGMGDKLFLVPIEQVQHASGKDYFVLSASSDLSKGFDDKNWPTEMISQDRSNANRTAATTPAPAATTAAPATPSTSSAAAPVSSTSLDRSASSSTPGTSLDDNASSTPATSLDTNSATPATASPPPN